MSFSSLKMQISRRRIRRFGANGHNGVIFALHSRMFQTSRFSPFNSTLKWALLSRFNTSQMFSNASDKLFIVWASPRECKFPIFVLHLTRKYWYFSPLKSFSNANRTHGNGTWRDNLPKLRSRSQLLICVANLGAMEKTANLLHWNRVGSRRAIKCELPG